MSKPQSTIYVIKEDGKKEEFLPEKLQTSLINTGANPTTAEKIVRGIVESMAKDSIIEKTTSDIYREAFHQLKEMSHAAAARYSLRRSLMEFGPTGFPFEAYIAEIFKKLGYETMIDQVVFGSCVPHEVDVVAWNDNKLLMAEVKYHNEPAGKTDLKVALYVKARYDDLKQNSYEYGQSRKLDEGWLITNTKFTDTAITYANCSGVKMLGWDYPETGSLREMIEETKLHPITCLTTMSASQKTHLMNKKIVLCRSVYDNKELLKEAGLSDLEILKVMEEISDIFKND